jgi:hypothetical protein
MQDRDAESRSKRQNGHNVLERWSAFRRSVMAESIPAFFNVQLKCKKYGALVIGTIRRSVVLNALIQSNILEGSARSARCGS